MDYTIIDAHAHLWLEQDAEWDGKKVKSLPNGRADFLGEKRQMLPPYMLDGRNTAEIFLSNMDYARVSAAVITQEFIDGCQNEYLNKIAQKYPDRFFTCGMPETRNTGFVKQAKHLIDKGFKALKIPAARLIMHDRRVYLNTPEMMSMFKMMEASGIILCVELADGDLQTGEMKEVINECPNLQIVIGHFGMVTRPGWHEQLKLVRYPNVWLESGGITWLFNDEYYPFKGAVRAIKEAADMVGIDKLMWGSDYPRTIVAITYKMSYDFVIKSDELTYEEKAKFLGQNAVKCFGFKNLVSLPYIKNMSE